MKRTRFGATIAIFVLCFLASTVLWAESQARIVRLSLVDGSVELDRATGKGFEKAIVNMPITQGMRLRTSSNSNAEVEFESGSTLRLIGNTTVSFGRLSLDDEGGKLTAVNVEEGTAYFDIKQEPHDDFAISFAGREFRLTHSSHLRVDVSDSDVEVAMFKGEAEMAGNPDVRLTSDHSLVFNRGDQGDQEALADFSKYDVNEGFTDEPSDSWDKQRQDYINNSEAQVQRDNPPLSPGLYDLNAYGNYYNDPSYGLFWRPYGVSYGWDPFSNGAWVWYPGFGYTWVSSYPWGWAPYRYGNWAWIPTYGWVWQPGYFNNWWQGPVFANAPAGYYAPRPPRHHDHTVVWVGRPQPGWTPNFHPHHERGDVPTRTTIYDGGEGGGRQRVATAAPANPGTTTRNIPGNGFVGGTPAANLNTTVPNDGQIVHRSDGGGQPRTNPIFVDRERRPRPGSTPTPATPVVTPQQGASTATPVTPIVPRDAKPHPQPATTHADVPRTTPHDTGRPSATPNVPRAVPHADTPRTAPVAPPHVDTPHVTPAPRTETPHAAPAPHVEAPHMSAPRAEAPHMSAPHMEAPHMSAPHMGGGGEAHGSGRGH